MNGKARAASFTRFTLGIVLCAAVLAVACGFVVNRVTATGNLNSMQLMLRPASEPADAVFYKLASKARYQIDQQVYPPVGKGSGSPGIALAALAAVLGDPLTKAIDGDADAWGRVLKQLDGYEPQFPTGYDPGWKYSNALPPDQARKAAGAVLAKVRAGVAVQRRLWASDEYRRLKEELADSKDEFRRYIHLSSEESEAVRWGVSRELTTPVMEEASRDGMQRRFEIVVELARIDWELNPGNRWHAKHGWKAEDYFEDAQAIALARAIEADDLAEMRRLIDAGADVNAPGKDGMTLLLWAMPDRRFDRFELLLKRGADPNVGMHSDFGVDWAPLVTHLQDQDTLYPNDSGCHVGKAVTHIACEFWDDRYFDAVFQNGGDANLPFEWVQNYHRTPLSMVLEDGMGPFGYTHAAKDRRAAVLIEQGARLRRRAGNTTRGEFDDLLGKQASYFRAALAALKRQYPGPSISPERAQPLAELVLRKTPITKLHIASFGESHAALVKWLEEHGADFDLARETLDASAEPWGETLKKKNEAAAAADRLPRLEAGKLQAQDLSKAVAAEPPPIDPDTAWSSLSRKDRWLLGDKDAAEAVLRRVNAKLASQKPWLPPLRLCDIDHVSGAVGNHTKVQFKRVVNMTGGKFLEVYAGHTTRNGKHSVWIKQELNHSR